MSIPRLSLVVFAVVGLFGCEPPSDAQGSVCDLAHEFVTCPECADGTTTCTYNGTSATELSCGECQARGVLYRQLCDDGVTDSAATVEDGTSCTTVPEF